MKKQILIAIAEDHDIVREGLVSLLQGHEYIKVVFDVKNGEQLLEKLKIVKPDIILLDLDMPIISGYEAFEKIKAKYPKIKIIIITANENDQIIIDFVKKKVNSYVRKDCNLDKLVDTIYAVQEDSFHFDSSIAKILASEVAASSDMENKVLFSERDLSILRLVCQGLTSKEIAEKLFMSSRTVEYHRSAMLKAVNLKNVSELIVYALKHKLIKIS